MWAKLDDQFYLNPKNATMDRDEQDLYIAGLVYCNGQLTDGFIPDSILPILSAWAKIEANAQASAIAIATRLVDGNHWERVAGGYMVHDFLDWNMSRDEVLELRNARTEAGKRGGLASSAKRQAIARANAQASAQAKSKQNPTQNQYQYQLNKTPTTTAKTDEFPEAFTSRAEKLFTQITGFAAIPSSNYSEILRRMESLDKAGKMTPEFMTPFFTEMRKRYPDSIGDFWLDWAVAGQVPVRNLPKSPNGKKPEGAPLTGRALLKELLRQEEEKQNGNPS